MSRAGGLWPRAGGRAFPRCAIYPRIGEARHCARKTSYSDIQGLSCSVNLQVWLLRCDDPNFFGAASCSNRTTIPFWSYDPQVWETMTLSWALVANHSFYSGDNLDQAGLRG